jgi:hypothetical protein
VNFARALSRDLSHFCANDAIRCFIAPPLIWRSFVLYLPSSVPQMNSINATTTPMTFVTEILITTSILLLGSVALSQISSSACRPPSQ